MQLSPLTTRIISTVLILLTLPFFFMASVVSLMAFDGVDPGMRAWIFVIVVIGTCFLVPVASFIGSWKLSGKGKSLHAILVGFIPAIVSALGFLWLMNQSFGA